MTEEDVAILAAMAGLTIDPAHVPGVIRNLEVLQRQAAVLAQARIDPAVEPAPVFHA